MPCKPFAMHGLNKLPECMYSQRWIPSARFKSSQLTPQHFILCNIKPCLVFLMRLVCLVASPNLCRLLRSSEYGRITLHLSLAMTLLCGMVFGSMLSAAGSAACFAFAFMVHYACLLLFMWIVVDAYSVHQRIEVFGGITKNTLWKAVVACWGMSVKSQNIFRLGC